MAKSYICDICKQRTFMEFSSAGKGSYCFVCYDKHIIDGIPIKKEVDNGRT